MTNQQCVCGDLPERVCSERAEDRQRILVFQQNGSGESKIRGIKMFGNDLFTLEVISIDVPLPPIVDDANEYLPSEFEAALVLDYLRHPDLSLELAALCNRLKIPMVASGKKLRNAGVMTPLTCCALSRQACLGRYGEMFGAPEYAVDVADGKIAKVAVLRGAPCGATWDAAARIIGVPVEDAGTRIGLETQFFCTANPAGWDPMYGKSPVHFAGGLHSAALVKALEQVR